MAIATDWPTKTFSVPQGDLTLVSGTLYKMDTEIDFRQAINAIMASEEGIVFDTPINHNTEVTVFGVTYARTIELINGYSVTFTPDSQWSVRLEGSNNNVGDIEASVLNQNQVQVIPTNAAGLVVIGNSSLSAAQDTSLTNIETQLTDIEGTFDHRELMKIISASVAGTLSGAETTTITIRDVNNTRNTLVVQVDEDGNRTEIVYNVS